jgi:hypothetical protein
MSQLHSTLVSFSANDDIRLNAELIPYFCDTVSPRRGAQTIARCVWLTESTGRSCRELDSNL